MLISKSEGMLHLLQIILAGSAMTLTGVMHTSGENGLSRDSYYQYQRLIGNYQPPGSPKMEQLFNSSFG